MRSSPVYGGFKALNGVLFVVLGAAIVVRMLYAPAPLSYKIPGLILGVAMFALGLHRSLLVLRARR